MDVEKFSEYFDGALISNICHSWRLTSTFMLL